jgi:pimeloyl-ACP methyl ester carboxylesterase
VVANDPGRALAGTPWLDVFCLGCGTSRAIDLRTLDRHPLASVGTLVLGLRCSWCPGSAPMPMLIGLFALPPVSRGQTEDLKVITVPALVMHGDDDQIVPIADSAPLSTALWG